VLHPGRVEGGPPALLVVPGKLEIVALARHAPLDVADAAPRVQPRTEGPEHGQVSVYTSRFQRDEEQASEAVSHGLRVPDVTSPGGIEGTVEELVGALAKLRDVLEAGEPEERKAVVRTFLRGIRINQKAGQAS